MRNLLIFIYFTGISISLTAQNKGTLGQFFYFKNIYETDDWNPRTIEQIIITSNLTAGGDQRLRDTLGRWGEKHFTRIDGQQLPRVRKHIRQIALRDYTAPTLPDELGAFENMTGLVFDGCTQLNVQTFHDELERRAAANPDDPLLHNLHGNLRSLIFRNADWSEVQLSQLPEERLPELQELRLIGISGLQDKLDPLLRALIKTYPNLRYLTLENCELDDKNQLKLLSNLRELKALNLSGNRLSALPNLPVGLEALDVSYNFFNALPPQVNGTAARDLRFLFIQCNLLENDALYDLPALLALDHELKTFSWTCNNVSDTAQINSLAACFDSIGFAKFASYARRYVDDFSPEMPSCEVCEQYRAAMVARHLENIYWKAEDSNLTFTSCIDASTQQILMCGGNLPKDLRFSYQLHEYKGPDNDPANQITLRLIPPAGEKEALIMTISDIGAPTAELLIQYEQPRRETGESPESPVDKNDWRRIVDKVMRVDE